MLGCNIIGEPGRVGDLRRMTPRFDFAARGLAFSRVMLSAKPQAAMRNATINLIFLAAVMPVMGVCKDRILAIASCDEVSNQIEHFLA